MQRPCKTEKCLTQKPHRGLVRVRAESEGEMKAVLSRVFTLEVDGRATLAFESSGTREDLQLCKDFQRSNGVPLGTVGSKLSVRLATAEEITVFEKGAQSAKPSDDMVLAYLIGLDRDRS